MASRSPPITFPITFAIDSAHNYKTIANLIKTLREPAGPFDPFDDVTATVRIGGQYVDLLVPNNIYSKWYNGEQRWRTPEDITARERAWRARLKRDVASLAERL